ncbi:MAG: restriction endonuclease subunit S [Treponema sp.]|uniref:restriction endonuclease subunit S n=1 Tax=Treponema sp. TaxID=166 RepID=UPI00298DDE29|nr:restriction endonuclease subunit S [Treponema sp.]MCQ2601738.1 restriction endonuclease subunit S [Treponema sp.]
MEEWKEVKLGEFIEFHRGYDLTKASIINGPYPVVCSTSIMGYHNEYKIKGPGIVIGRSGTLGEVQYIETDFWPHNTSLYVSNFFGNDPKFVKYFLKIIGTGNVGGGSAVPTLNRNHLQSINVKAPPLPTQQKIAQILSSLDDKIELNNKINANLEQQAQALFKSWFVGFEPFGGEMPAEWKEKPLYEYADFINGTSFKEDEYGTIGVPIIKIAELKNGFTDATQYFNGTKDSKYDVKDGDILFSWSGNPETSIDIFIWTLGNAILNQHTFNVKSNTNRKWFTYCLLKYFKPEFCHRAGCKQTTGLGHVTANDLKQIMFSSDEKSEIDFEKLITPVMGQIYNNKKENQKLAFLRDSLLPKLMNGEMGI